MLVNSNLLTLNFKNGADAKACGSLLWDVKRLVESFPEYKAMGLTFTPESALLIMLQQAATEFLDLTDNPPVDD